MEVGEKMRERKWREERGRRERMERRGDEMRWGRVKEGIIWTVLKERWRYELRRQIESERVKAAHRSIRKYRNMNLLSKILNGKNPTYFHFKIWIMSQVRLRTSLGIHSPCQWKLFCPQGRDPVLFFRFHIFDLQWRGGDRGPK
jgi:hypothetical protein